MTALFLSAAILAVSLLIMLSGTENALYEYKTNSEIKLSDLSKKKKETDDTPVVDYNIEDDAE